MTALSPRGVIVAFLARLSYNIVIYYITFYIMNRKMKTRMQIIGVIVIFAALIGGYVWYKNMPGQYDNFAQCIKDSGATFYGAFWCPHCQEQKKMFGNSARFLPYVECSTPDGQSTRINCQQKNVTQYPTWEFSDGTRQVGQMTFEALATKTSCALPQ